jgi:hypothetical protein
VPLAAERQLDHAGRVQRVAADHRALVVERDIVAMRNSLSPRSRGERAGVRGLAD